MKNEALKIVKVYTQNGKQVAFDVQNAAGTQRVDKATVVGAIKNGHSYVNATVTSSGVVRVDANVPREPMQRDKTTNPEIHYPFEMEYLHKNIRVGYYNTPNNYKPVPMKFKKVDASELTEADNYFYFTIDEETAYFKVDFKPVSDDDYMTVVMIQVIAEFYDRLADYLYCHLYDNEDRRVIGDFKYLRHELIDYNYPYISEVLGDRKVFMGSGIFGIHIHDCVVPFDVIEADDSFYGNIVFRTEYAYDVVMKHYETFMELLDALFKYKHEPRYLRERAGFR